MGLSELLNSVPNTSLCNWFYYMFILNLIAAVILLIRIIYILIQAKVSLGLGSLTFIFTLASMIIPLVNGAFFYALCDRSLNKHF